MTLAINQEVAVPKKKHGMLPILIVLFLASYGLMSELVVEQGRTIDAQRGLITSLLSDSIQLNSMKMKEILRQRALAHPGLEGQSPVAPQAQIQKQNKNGDGLRSREMQRPPKPTADAADWRRTPLSI